MYCQHCGAESTQGLNYCNRCGGHIGALTQSPRGEAAPAPVSAGTAWAVGVSMLLLVVIGMGITFSMVREFAHSGLPPEAIVIIVMCGAATVLASAFMLTRFWMRLLTAKANEPAGRQPHALYAPPANANDLGPQRFAGALPDAPVPASVTEHTTRTLEHAKRK